jgi:hypothetical protein
MDEYFIDGREQGNIFCGRIFGHFAYKNDRPQNGRLRDCDANRLVYKGVFLLGVV